VSSSATLELDSASAVASSATLTVASGAAVDLTYAGTDTIGALYVGGVLQPAGVYGASASNPGGVFTGTGTLTVPGAVSSYPTPGITGFTVSGTAPTSVTISATNGLANGTYYLLESTNLSLPLHQWTVIYTNTFNGSGDIVGQQIPVAHQTDAEEFYILLQSTNASAFP
jgi:hypothetical protein